MPDKTAIVVLACSLIGSAIVWVALASVGEPQSAWLACDVLGMEICP